MSILAYGVCFLAMQGFIIFATLKWGRYKANATLQRKAAEAIKENIKLKADYEIAIKRLDPLDRRELRRKWTRN